MLGTFLFWFGFPYKGTNQNKGARIIEYGYWATKDALSGAGARTLLERLEAGGCRLNSVVYTGAMRACNRDLEWEEAVGLFTKMRRTTMQTNLITFNTLLDACGNGGQWEGALKVLGQLSETLLEANSRLAAPARLSASGGF